MRKKRVFILICTVCIFLFLIIWIVESIHISKLVEQTFAMAYESDGQYEMSKYPVIFDEHYNRVSNRWSVQFSNECSLFVFL